MDTECWNKTADNCKKFLTKGSCIYVEGKIKVSKWNDKSGSPRQKFYLGADLVRFLPNSKKQVSENNIEIPEPSANIKEMVEEQDMPF
jgi:single stranded DNA-binding protein